MNWIENILIIAGISLDIFAAMEIEGAMLADVKRKSLLIACTIVTLLQLIFFFGGYFICYELEKYQVINDAQEVGYIVATIVFALLGIRLIVVSGIYTGYHFGFESKTGAYVVGALLLWVAGGEILLRNVMHMI